MASDFHAWLCRRGRARSADQYSRVVGRWLREPAVVEEMLVSASFSPNYRRHLVACLRAWAVFDEDGELEQRLLDLKLPSPVPRDVRDPLPFEQWIKVRAAIAESDLRPAKRIVCSIIALRGIRSGDVLRLEKKSVGTALRTGTLAFEAKGERWLRYSARPLIPFLEELRDQSWGRAERVRNLISPGSREDKSQATAGRAVRRAFDRIAHQLGMDPRELFAHRFRHTYSTYFLRQMEGDPEAVFKLQAQMGWARLDTAANYLRRSRRDELDEIEFRLLESNG